MLSVVLVILSWYKCKSDLLNSSQKTLNYPSWYLSWVILNFLSQTLSHHHIKILFPVALVLLILKESICILVCWFNFILSWRFFLPWLLDIWVHTWSNTNPLFISNIPDLVHITKSSSNLVLNFNEWIFLIKSNFLVLLILAVSPWVINSYCFLHKLSHSINSVIIYWLVILRCLINSQ